MSASVRRMPWGVVLALAAGLYACRSSEGERCICADDCRTGLVCVAEGRVLMAGECSPVTGSGANPGVCVSEEEAGVADEGGGPPDVFMDLGSKRDFDPGPPPDPDTDTDGTSSGTASETGSSSGSDSSGTSGSSSSSGGSSDSGGTSSSDSGGTSSSDSGGTSGSGSSSSGGSSSGSGTTTAGT